MPHSLKEATEKHVCCPEHTDVELKRTATVANLALAAHLASLKVYCPNALQLPLESQTVAGKRDAEAQENGSADADAESAQRRDQSHSGPSGRSPKEDGVPVDPYGPSILLTPPAQAKDVAHDDRDLDVLLSRAAAYAEGAPRELQQLGAMNGAAAPGLSLETAIAYNARGEPTAQVARRGLLGCTALITLGELEGHLKLCRFRAGPCPNDGCKAAVPKANMALHLAECGRGLCRNAPLGCTFRGRPAQLAAHVEECGLSNSALAKQATLLRDMQAKIEAVRALLQNVDGRLDRAEKEPSRLGGRGTIAVPAPVVRGHTSAQGRPAWAGNPAAYGRVQPDNGRNAAQGQTAPHGRLSPTPLARVGFTGHAPSAGATIAPSLPSFPTAGAPRQLANDGADSQPKTSHGTAAAVRQADPPPDAPSSNAATPSPHAKAAPLLPEPEPEPAATASPDEPDGDQVLIRPDQGGEEMPEELEWPFNFQCIGTLGGHAGPVWCIAAHGHLLFTSGTEASIGVWDLGKRQPTRKGKLQGHTAVVHVLHVKAPFLWSGDAERTVKAWRLDTLACHASFRACSDIVSGLVTVGRFLVAASFAAISVFDLKEGRLHKTLRSGMKHWVRAMANAPGDERIYSASHNLLQAWEAPDFEEVCSALTSHGSIHSIAATASKVIVGTYNQNIYVYRAQDLQLTAELKGHLGTVHSLAVSKSGQYLFSASIDTVVKVMWGVEGWRGGGG
jgi:hypothetical protein